MNTFFDSIMLSHSALSEATTIALAQSRIKGCSFCSTACNHIIVSHQTRHDKQLVCHSSKVHANRWQRGDGSAAPQSVPLYVLGHPRPVRCFGVRNCTGNANG